MGAADPNKLFLDIINNPPRPAVFTYGVKWAIAGIAFALAIGIVIGVVLV